MLYSRIGLVGTTTILSLKNLRYVNIFNRNISICIVGSGPAGFGVAQYLLKNDDKVQIDMLDKSPVPYGLIRYGVSPDHQDVKNCINGYEKVAKNERFSFFGNLAVGGNELSLTKLLSLYNAVVLCTGAQHARKLNIPGENCKNVFTSNEFVGWYNGDPKYAEVKPDLNGRTAVILGVGNVALDCARMLFKPIEVLGNTDITNYAFEALKLSSIDTVIMVGRRGLLQMSCTRKEMSEIATIPGVHVSLNDCVTPDITAALKIKDLKKRKQVRLVKYVLDISNKLKKDDANKHFDIKLLRSPLEILSTNYMVNKIITRKNKLQGDDPFEAKMKPLNETEEINCDLIISCLGYENKPISKEIPFESGKVLNTDGKVNNIPNLYACGWCKDGAKGVLADTLNDSLLTGKTIISDIDKIQQINTDPQTIRVLLKDLKGAKITTWEDWKLIDKLEKTKGEEKDKVRDKIVDFNKSIFKEND